MHIDNNDYTEIPSGQMWIHHAWSGDMAAAASYMPKGVPVDVVGYWFPADGKGPMANDTNTILRGAQNPVLAHLFLNYLQDLDNALTNISYNGYMQPVYGVTEDRLVHEGILPKSLTSTVVLPENLKHGLWELAAAGRVRPGLAAGLANREPGNLEEAGDGGTKRSALRRAAHARPRPQEARQHNRFFYMLLAVPGIIWLTVLFIVPFYDVLAIAGGRLNFLTGSPVAVYNPLNWSHANLVQTWHGIFGATSLPAADHLAHDLVHGGGLGACAC